MTSSDRHLDFARLAVVALLAAGWGCAATTPVREPAPVVAHPGGFTITEQLGVSEAVSRDFQHAVSALETGNYASGISILQKVVSQEPAATAAHINLGMAYRRTDRLDEAEAALLRALELNPSHPVALNELGLLYRETGRFTEARQQYEAALAVYPDFHFARRNLAVLCDMYLGDIQCALDNYERYSAAVPGDAEAAMWVADLRNRIAD